jgi:hypothetical protein
MKAVSDSISALPPGIDGRESFVGSIVACPPASNYLVGPQQVPNLTNCLSSAAIIEIGIVEGRHDE